MNIAQASSGRLCLRGWALAAALSFTLLGSAPPAQVNTAQAAPPALQEPEITMQTMVSGLDTPWAMDFAPDGRIFINERPGRIRVVENGQLLPDPWLTIDAVVENGESGLLGIALDPDFKNNGFVYVAYTHAAGQNPYVNRLSRFHENPQTKRGGEEKVLIDGIRGSNNHNGGGVRFGPDGKLYWTMGERFQGALAQDRSNLNGKILRLNPDGSVPADNPFPDSYIWTYGHRNPQGLAWQPGTNNLFATEHGPSGENGCCNDEVNLIEKGKNYGWPLIVGDQQREGMVTPLINSGDNGTWAPSGITFVSAGPWKGSLVFGALRGQALYRATIDPNDPRKITGLESYFKGELGRIRNVYETPEKDGNLIILTSNRDGRGTPRSGDDKMIKLVFSGTGSTTPSVPGTATQTFAETGKTVNGIFLDYWRNNGGLPQQGYPISDLMNEKSDLDGKTYTVQYFERAVFEYHPEQSDPRFQVLLSQLGTFQFKKKYPDGAAGQQPSTQNPRVFPETGKTVGGKFREYWEKNGGLAQQGYPISDEMVEKSDLDRNTYLVQYFERAVMEYHPENQAPYDVLLSQLGTFQYRAKYGGGGR
jgi:glucose/arabinose dehydrogenase